MQHRLTSGSGTELSSSMFRHVKCRNALLHLHNDQVNWCLIRNPTNYRQIQIATIFSRRKIADNGQATMLFFFKFEPLKKSTKIFSESHAFSLENAFENVLCEMVGILCRPQYVNFVRAFMIIVVLNGSVSCLVHPQLWPNVERFCASNCFVNRQWYLINLAWIEPLIVQSDKCRTTQISLDNFYNIVLGSILLPTKGLYTDEHFSHLYVIDH